MRKPMTKLLMYATWLSVALVSACASNEHGKQSGAGDAGGQNDAAGGGNDADVSDDAAAHGDAGAEDGGGGGLDAEADASGTHCGLVVCGTGQRCEQTSSGAACVDNECTDLTCGATEECSPAASGGHYCASIACASDVQCPEARHCDGTKCVEDVCKPAAARCENNQVFECSSNGGADELQFSCAGGAYFASACEAPAEGSAFCSCEDDWDCPSFTACTAGTCQGTGVAPTCTLPSLPFQDVLPTRELHWGGESTTSKAATGRPFANHAQVTMTPVVANLDDDNGDGLVNELDFPELVFLAYPDTGDDTGLHQKGIVRAVHVGGPKKGQDYFALCGADNAKHWFEGEAVDALTCANDEGVVRSGGGVAVGDLDYDGIPEIVVPLSSGAIQILDHRGRVITTSDPVVAANLTYPQVGLVNLDNRGFVEIVVGNIALTLEKNDAGALRVLDFFVGAGTKGAQGEFGPTACPANVIDADRSDADVSQEIVVGTVLYRLPTPPRGVTKVAECAAGDPSDFCSRKLSVVWNARMTNTTADVPDAEAFCAVADVLGQNAALAPSPSNPLDGIPEVVLVSNGRVLVLRASDGLLLRKIDVEPGKKGGAPNVDDFDGDGFPEIAMASSGFYTVIDLQETNADHCPAWNDNLTKAGASPGTNPVRTPGGSCTSSADCNAGSVCNTTVGQCVCLHNGWKRATEDDSSQVTSSSVFDFNGDGAAEVVYNDECYFRIYDGVSGVVHLAVPSLSRTVLENPVVADVDNDGNAEIVIVNNNERLQCGELTLTHPDGTSVARADLPNGIQVWGDASDTWVSARRIWNQHAYHVTNVTESSQVPLKEPESWKPYGNRIYNTYRSQPRAFGVAPDLALVAMQVSSPDVACGELSDQVQIVVLVTNRGDLRVGPGVKVTFYGEWNGAPVALHDSAAKPLAVTLQTSLEPSASVLVSVAYHTQDDSPGVLPDKVIALVDEDEAERECVETNNRIEQTVSAGEQLADLRLVVGAASGPCSATKVSVTVHNDGSLAANRVRVRLYAGDPSAGGQSVGEVTLAGPIAPSGSATAEVSLGNLERTVTVFGVVDPLDAIPECNNANNLDQGPMIACGIVVL